MVDTPRGAAPDAGGLAAGDGCVLRPGPSRLLLQAGVAVLGGFWAARGLETLALPQATATSLLQILPDFPRGVALGLSRTAGALQLVAGVGLFVGRWKPSAARAGLVVTGAMLLVVAMGFERLRGTECGCLQLLGIRTFGWANLGVLSGSLVAFGALGGHPEGGDAADGVALGTGVDRPGSVNWNQRSG